MEELSEEMFERESGVIDSGSDEALAEMVE